MKTKLFTFTFCLFLIVLLAWLLHNKHETPPELPTPKTNTEQTPEQKVPSQTPSVVASTNSGVPTSAEFAVGKEDREKRRQARAENSLNEWRTPIEFYGMVVDESNNAVSGVQIDFSCNDLSPTGTSDYHTTSDGNGFFALKNVTGKLLVLNISKNGYYTSKKDNNSFEYGGSHSVSSPSNPIIFHLRKKSEGAALIHYDKSFRLPRDGTPILIDLATGNATSSGENALKVEGWTYDSQKKEGWKYDWKYRVSVPGGELQFYADEFPFLAPESNYISEDVIDMPVTNSVPWSYIVHRNYYIHTADGKFGRMIFTMVAGGDNFCELNCYFNPSGSRNLEPQ